jgi:hypothetical protein
MRKTLMIGAQILPILLLVVQCACTSMPVDAMRRDTSASANNEIELIRDYRRWIRVNPVPAVFHANIAAACAPVTSTMDDGSPHRDKFITVYVNLLGRQAMMTEKNPHFPQGSIILKEKLPSKDSTSPELLTVMIKREAGFNPENGDWEYMALDGAGKQVQARGRLENCQSCHTLVKTTDFVYRNYLPREISEPVK